MNRHVQVTPVPGIFAVNARADARRRAGRTLINLGQAIPFFGPPAWALDAWRPLLDAPDLHRYTLDPGRPALRETWARLWRGLGGSAVDPDREMLITAGANGAYLTAVLALLAPGERMGLLTPFYFNHAMAVTMTGGEVVEIPVRADAAYQPDPDEVIRVARDRQVRAVTLVTPNNPTGATWDPARVRALIDGLGRAGVRVIVDETYLFFPGPGETPTVFGGVEERPGNVITIGSFSKTFGITGWRVGYVMAAADLVAEMVKVHDTMVICAPTPGQRLVESCLAGPWEAWLAERRADLDRRRALVATVAPRLGGGWRVGALGRFFAWVDGPADGRETAFRLLDDHDLVLIPGDVFGHGWDRSFRLSLGGTSETDLTTGLERLCVALGT